MLHVTDRVDSCAMPFYLHLLWNVLLFWSLESMSLTDNYNNEDKKNLKFIFAVTVFKGSDRIVLLCHPSMQTIIIS